MLYFGDSWKSSGSESQLFQVRGNGEALKNDGKAL